MECVALAASHDALQEYAQSHTTVVLPANPTPTDPPTSSSRSTAAPPNSVSGNGTESVPLAKVPRGIPIVIQFSPIYASSRRSVPLAMMQTDEILSVNLRPECLKSRRPLPSGWNLNFEHFPRRKKVAAVEQAKKATEVVTAIAASAGAGMVAVQAARSTIIFGLAECTPEFDESLGRMSNPFQMSLSDEQYGEFLAASTLNHVFIFGIPMSHALIGFVYAKKNGLSVYDGFVWCRFPSLSVLPLMYFVEPTCSAAVTVAIYGESLWHRVVGFISVSLTFALLVGLFIYLKRSWGAIMVPGKNPALMRRRYRVAISDDDDAHAREARWKLAVRQFLSSLEYWIDGGVSWKDQPGRKGYCRSHRLWFMDFTGQYNWFVMVEIGLAAFMGALDGIKLGPGKCDGVIFAVIVPLFVFLLVIAVARPYNAPFLGTFSIGATFLQFAAAAFMAGAMFSGKESYQVMAEDLTLIGLYLIIGRAIFDIAPKLKQMLTAIFRGLFVRKEKGSTNQDLTERLLVVVQEEGIADDITTAVEMHDIDEPNLELPEFEDQSSGLELDDEFDTLLELPEEEDEQREDMYYSASLLHQEGGERSGMGDHELIQKLRKRPEENAKSHRLEMQSKRQAELDALLDAVEEEEEASAKGRAKYGKRGEPTLRALKGAKDSSDSKGLRPTGDILNELDDAPIPEDEKEHLRAAFNAAMAEAKSTKKGPFDTILGELDRAEMLSEERFRLRSTFLSIAERSNPFEDLLKALQHFEFPSTAKSRLRQAVVKCAAVSQHTIPHGIHTYDLILSELDGLDLPPDDTVQLQFRGAVETAKAKGDPFEAILREFDNANLPKEVREELRLVVSRAATQRGPFGAFLDELERLDSLRLAADPDAQPIISDSLRFTCHTMAEHAFTCHTMAEHARTNCRAATKKKGLFDDILDGLDQAEAPRHQRENRELEYTIVSDVEEATAFVPTPSSEEHKKKSCGEEAIDKLLDDLENDPAVKKREGMRRNAQQQPELERRAVAATARLPAEDQQQQLKKKEKKASPKRNEYLDKLLDELEDETSSTRKPQGKDALGERGKQARDTLARLGRVVAEAPVSVSQQQAVGRPADIEEKREDNRGTGIPPAHNAVVAIEVDDLLPTDITHPLEANPLLEPKTIDIVPMLSDEDNDGKEEEADIAARIAIL